MDFALGATFGGLLVFVGAFLTGAVYAWKDDDWRRAVRLTALSVFLLLLWIVVFALDYTMGQKLSLSVFTLMGYMLSVYFTEQSA